MGWLWLAGSVAAAAGAYLIGWPAWSGHRAREARDLNTERYLAWRGRADRGASRSMSEGMTGDERRRLLAAGVLAVLALVSLVAFFGTT